MSSLGVSTLALVLVSMCCGFAGQHSLSESGVGLRALFGCFAAVLTPAPPVGVGALVPLYGKPALLAV